MRANELMIGDWVISNHNKAVCQIDPIIAYGIIDAILKNDPDIDNHFEPIYLTPEILEKNGFHNEDDCWLSDDYSYGVDDQQGLMEFFKYETHELDSKLEAQIPRCYCVHEL